MDYYWAARYLGRCVVLAQRDASLREETRTKLARSYADRAMQLLQPAVERGYKEVSALKTLSALAPLRNRPDFQKLVQSLETA